MPILDTPIIAHVIEQHAEEAAFLWLLRDAAVGEPHYALADLTALDERVEAHLDGLKIAGSAGWDICVDELKFEEAGELFTATVLAFGSNEMTRIQLVLDTARQSPELARGLISALGWLPYEMIAQRVEQLARAESSALRCIGIAAMAVHRQDPGDLLTRAIDTDDPKLRKRALRAAGELGRSDLLPVLRQHLGDSEPETAVRAAWSAALLGEISASEVLWTQYGNLSEPVRSTTLDMAMRRADPATALQWQQELAADATSLRHAVIAAGVIGDPALIPWILEQIADQSVARVAGEAFTMITGIDLAFDDLECDAPDGFEAGASDAPDDDNVALDADEDLPWPDASLIAPWWDDHASNFVVGKRYLIGQPITEESLESALREGSQRQRRAAALELALRRPGTSLFEIRGRGCRQQKLLGVR
jgi:uncharacterized protein (TIGR02270 family)